MSQMKEYFYEYHVFSKNIFYCEKEKTNNKIKKLKKKFLFINLQR